MKKLLYLGLLLLIAATAVVTVNTTAAANDDYRLDFGDVVSVTFWADGYEEGLQVKEISVRPDGKVALAFTVTQLDNYRIGPGDTVSINVWGHSELNASGLIRSDGKVAFPMIGELQVEGLTPAELTNILTESLKAYIKEPVVTVNVTRPRRIPVMEVIPATGLTADELTQSIKDVLSKYMNNPQVVLTFTKFRTVRVYVLGEANKPGMYEISKSHTLLDAIGAAEGYTKFANKKNVYVVHKSTGQYQKADLNKLLKKGDLTQNYALDEGDVVYLTPNGLSFVNDILPYISAVYEIGVLIEK